MNYKPLFMNSRLKTFFKQTLYTLFKKNCFFKRTAVEISFNYKYETDLY